MNRINFSHSLWRITCVLFLTLLCSGQVYQAAHLHHFHENDLVAFKVSAHPIASVVVNENTHHHHEEDSSHEDDGEHNLKTTIDWNISRSKTATHLTFDFGDVLAPVPEYSLGTVVFDKTYPSPQTLSCLRESYTAYLIIRGPPQLA